MVRYMFKRTAVIALLVLGLTSVAPLGAKAEVSDEQVKAFVTSLAETAVSSLTGAELEREVRKERFRLMVDEYFAINAIAKWVLGRHWRRATTDQRAEYLMLFEGMLLERYVDGFKDYSGESLEVDRAERRGEKDFIVHTSLKKPGATKAVDVSWRVGVGDNEGKAVLKVVDIFVNGLSMSRSQQDEFNSLIRNNGNSVESLLEKMREIAKPAK